MTLDTPKSSHPHDDFYRQALSHQHVAKDFFASNLPKYVLEIVDLNTLKPEKDTFSDPQLGKGAADALFSVKFGDEDGYLMLLSEHQSTAEHFMAFRLKKYMMMIWEKHRSQYPKNKYLPLLYGLVYYTGKESYTAPLDFFSLFKRPELAKSFFTDPYQLIDLHRTPNEEIARTVWLGAMLMVMKYAQNSDILPHLLDMKAMLAEIGGVNYLYIEAIFKYIINQAETDEIYKVLDIFKEVVPERDKTKLMTIAERLKQEGIQLGKQEGIQLGKQEGIQLGEQRGIQLGEQKIREIVLNMLAKGQSISFISEVTGLSEAEIQKIAESKNNTH